MNKSWHLFEREFGEDIIVLLDRHVSSHHALDYLSSEGVLWRVFEALYDNGYTIVKKEDVNGE